MAIARPWGCYSLTATAVCFGLFPLLAQAADPAGGEPTTTATAIAIDSHLDNHLAQSLAWEPGVYLIDDNGYGLRPHIGVRGVSPLGSGRITLLEDGVPAAMAPYLAAESGYLPGLLGVEGLTRAPLGHLHPRGLGSVLSWQSRKIPKGPMVKALDLGYGNDATSRVHGMIGGEKDQWGSLLEYLGGRSSGYAELPGDQDSGFRNDEFLFKIREATPRRRGKQQQMEFKLRHSRQRLDQSAFGLTDADFQSGSGRLYGAAQADRLELERTNYQLTHQLQLPKGERVVTRLYYNDISDDSYLADAIDGLALGAGGVAQAALFEQQAAELPLGSRQTVTMVDFQRAIETWGFQSAIEQQVDDHQLRLRVRYHQEKSNSQAREDALALDTQLQMTAMTIGAPGDAGRWREEAESWSLILEDNLQWQGWDISLGLGYDNSRLTFEQRGAGRQKNNASATLLSASGRYPLNLQWQLGAAFRQGYAPVSAAHLAADDEESRQWQLGLYYRQDKLRFSAEAYLNELDDLQGQCLVQLGCRGALAPQSTGADIEVSGLELSLDYGFEWRDWQVPVSLGYSFASSEFQNDIQSSFALWGNARRGDEVAYLPEHKVQLNASVVADAWRVSLAVSYQTEQRSIAGQGDIPAGERLDPRTLVDLSAEYRLAEDQQLYLSAQNINDEEYRAARFNGSIQSGKPASIMVGYRITF